ncbi:domain of Kin17 curved DNA-binding protein-domain-containing protein [Astrocystis sublimbata]|nr:domain of Kin17 curved DNA-binding protein-domain-containing protein [Astrocystis sublimbata]
MTKKHDAGSRQDLAKRMKMKGLQRLRFYCQPCSAMLLVGEDTKKHIEDYSNQFRQSFIQLLRTSHGEKSVQINQFYQTFIANKEHIHMNATRWPSLTEFAKYLGREGLCRVEETDKGIHIAWIDDSPEALRRKEAIRRAKKYVATREQEDDDNDREEAPTNGLSRQEGEKVKLSFGLKPLFLRNLTGANTRIPDVAQAAGLVSASAPTTKPDQKRVRSCKENALAGGQKKGSCFEQPKKMSEAERIMKEELERSDPAQLEFRGTL